LTVSTESSPTTPRNLSKGATLTTYRQMIVDVTRP
jgi:hypothetical protein